MSGVRFDDGRIGSAVTGTELHLAWTVQVCSIGE